jgi:hypothetical protein
MFSLGLKAIYADDMLIINLLTRFPEEAFPKPLSGPAVLRFIYRDGCTLVLHVRTSLINLHMPPSQAISSYISENEAAILYNSASPGVALIISEK